MKKISLILAALLCVMLLVAGCTNDKNTNENDNLNVDPPVSEDEKQEDINENVTPMVVNVGSLKGPTSMGLVKVMENAANEDTNYIYDFNVEAAADAITPRFLKGELDIIAVPANLAAVLYNKTEGEVVALNINTLGVLYIVENGNAVNNVEDLRGKTIYASGKGNTPEYALNYMLSAYGLVPGQDVFIEFKAEHAECVAALSNNENSVAMLPQPFVTTAQISDSNIRIALDINKAWEEKAGKTLVTGVTVARREFVNENPDAVKDFMLKHKNSAAYVNENITEAASLIEQFGIFKAKVAEKAIPFCKISCIEGEELKTALSDYLGILYSQNPASIGGALPKDDFYFVAE